MRNNQSNSMSSGYEAPAVNAAIRLVELLCESADPLGISEISQKIAINKHTVVRLLGSLVAQGWVLRHAEGAKYSLSLRPFHHVSKPVQRMTLRVAAEGPMRELWRATGQSTYLGVLDDDHVLYIEHLDATGAVKVAGRVGGRYALHCSAPGKVVLAYAGEQLLRRFAQAGLSRQTAKTMCDLDQLREHLADIVRQGHALDNQEYADGLLCFAVPIFNHRGEVEGTIGQSVLTLHFTPTKFVKVLGPQIIAAGQEISRAMGYPSDGAA